LKWFVNVRDPYDMILRDCNVRIRIADWPEGIITEVITKSFSRNWYYVSYKLNISHNISIHNLFAPCESEMNIKPDIFDKEKKDMLLSFFKHIRFFLWEEYRQRLVQK
jgi:hypothetical protein